MSLLFAEKIKNNQSLFLQKVIAISHELDIDPNWLMFVMNFESGMDPQKINPITNAVGLIQFMPSTAKALGTSFEQLKSMSNVQQLDYVKKYLYPYRSRIKSLIDLYLAVFFPIAIDKPTDYILEAKNLSRSVIAKANPIFDKNKDGQITVGEVQDILFNYIPVNFQSLIKKKELKLV